jgi:transposase-like protein
MSTELNRVLRDKYRSAGLPARVTGRRPKFSPEQVAQLIAQRQSGRSIMSLAREHRTSQSVIAKYVREGFQPARWTA